MSKPFNTTTRSLLPLYSTAARTPDLTSFKTSGFSFSIRLELSIDAVVYCGSTITRSSKGIRWQCPSPLHCSACSPGMCLPCVCKIAIGRPAAIASQVLLPFFITKSIPSGETRWIPTVLKLGGYETTINQEKRSEFEKNDHRRRIMKDSTPTN